MIITKLRGGLGNQMFQYAFGRILALKKGVPLALDVSHYKAAGSRTFSLQAFEVRPDKLLSNPLLIRLRTSSGRYSIIKDIPPDSFDPEKIPDKTSLNGYWESYKYWKDTVPALKKEFVLKSPSDAFKAHASEIPKGSISVHVRRGDYLVPHGKYLNGKEYFEKAASLIISTKKLSHPHITIFSDDREWCKKELSTLGGHPTTVFEDSSVSDAEELILMSLYENNVICNSTFSWWSAFLNQNAGKMVVAPSDWFTDPAVNERYRDGLIPEEWRIIES